MNKELFPEQEIVFLDTCSFNPKENNHKLISREEYLSSLIQSSICLRNTTRFLSKKDNWLVIPEVIEEVKAVFDYFYMSLNNIRNIKESRKRFSIVNESKNQKKHREYTKSREIIDNLPKLEKAYKRAVRARERLVSLLEQDFRDAIAYSSYRYQKKINALLPEIETIFKSRGGKPNYFNTDCKLITTALVYGHDCPIYLASYDKVLSETFSQAITELNLPVKNAFLLNNGLYESGEYYQKFVNTHKTKSNSLVHLV
ncbi:MAG: hypothetical protein WC438_05110 [Candidatus Pacearchaeota archaeon]